MKGNPRSIAPSIPSCLYTGQLLFESFYHLVIFSNFFFLFPFSFRLKRAGSTRHSNNNSQNNKTGPSALNSQVRDFERHEIETELPIRMIQMQIFLLDPFTCFSFFHSFLGTVSESCYCCSHQVVVEVGWLGRSIFPNE
jgi:hypothetical protein